MPPEWTDPDDAPELTAEFFEHAIPMIGDRVIAFDECAAAAQAVIRRGRPLASRKKRLVSIRYDVEILDAFQATGPGWQTRMNDALREWIRSHPAG